MGAAKAFWEEYTLRIRDEVTPETLEETREIVQRKLQEVGPEQSQKKRC